MKQMKTKLIVLTLVVALTVVFLGFAQSSYAQQTTPLIKQKMQQQASNEFREVMKKRLENSPAVKMKELIESLNLTEEQKIEIRKINLDFQKAKLELRNNIRINYLEIKSLFLDTKLDTSKIRAELQENANLEVELKMKKIEEYLAIKDLLTAEQQEKLPLGMPLHLFELHDVASKRLKTGF